MCRITQLNPEAKSHTIKERQHLQVIIELIEIYHSVDIETSHMQWKFIPT